MDTIQDDISEVLQFGSIEKGKIEKKPSSINPLKDTKLEAGDRGNGRWVEQMNVETQPRLGERRSMSISLVTGPGSLVLLDLVCLLLCARGKLSRPSKSKFPRV